MNIDQAIKEASINLRKNRIRSAFLDCEILMAKVLKKSRNFIIMNPNEEINSDVNISEYDPKCFPHL